MKHKRGPFFVLVLTAITIISGCSRAIETSTGVPTGNIETASGTTVERMNASDEAFVADESADANASDVLIPAAKAKTAPDIVDGRWINSEATTVESLRGRVVLVDFWTFGCYNCRNTLPVLKRFDTAYREKGLTILGVHTPESDYERKFENVLEAVGRYGIKYPVVTDVEEATWRAYSVEAWPTVIILDKQGRVRYTHVGEGRYDIQESVIRTLLSDN